MHACCAIHDESPCPQEYTGHEDPCNGPGAPRTCVLEPADFRDIPRTPLVEIVLVRRF